MSASVKQNFDWSETKRKLVILSLNYNRGPLVDFSIQKFATSVPKQDWLYVVGNDEIDCDFGKFYDRNVRFFTLTRGDKTERNGSFIRNYFIKRCQSDLLMQKDGEVVLLDDCVANCINHQAWRPGWIYVLNPKHSDMYRGGQLQDPQGDNQAFNMHGFPNRIVDHENYSSDFAKRHIMAAAGGFCIATYYHYAYCVPTKILYNMHGYDEAYTYYGFEDSDMFCRLAHLGVCIKPDYGCRAVHLWHDKQIISHELSAMGELFRDKSPSGVMRNLNVWGEGE